jgi:PBSX family phage terminase large subunit
VNARLSPKQARSVVGSNRHINLFHGAIRSGKTLASSLAWLGFVESGPPGKLLMVGKTLETLERNVLDPMAELFPARIQDDAVRHTRGANTATILGRLVHLVGANDQKAEGRIRGLTLAGAYVDEASLVPEGFWTQLLGRLSVPGARLFATTNPDSPFHWLKVNYLDREEHLDLRSWHFTLKDNPGLDPAFVEHIEAEYVGLWRKRFLLGLWVLAEGAIYDGWDPDVHVVRRLPVMTRWWVGIDYGTVNPFVALLIGLGVDGRVYVVSEYRWDSRATMRQKTDSEYSLGVRQWLQEPRQTGDSAPIVPPVEWVIVDPSAASFIRQLYVDGVRGVRSADNEVLDGIRLVASTLAQDRLRVHESCKGLIAEMPGYVWSPLAQQKGIDEPVKLNDHANDALRYSLRTARSLWWGVRLEAA